MPSTLQFSSCSLINLTSNYNKRNKVNSVVLKPLSAIVIICSVLRASGSQCDMCDGYDHCASHGKRIRNPVVISGRDVKV